MQKTWFITGASKGFGLEITRAALAKGDKVAAAVRGEAGTGLDELAKTAVAATGSDEVGKMAGATARLRVVRMDVTKEQEVRAAVEQAVGWFGQLDIVVNNAGYGIVGGIEEISDAEAKRQYDTNVFGVLNVIRAVLPFLRKQRSGHIINVSSLFAFDAIPGWGLYGSTKFAVEGISQGLAKELEPFGIKVTAIEPGLFTTEFTARGSYVVAAKPIADYTATMVGAMRAGTDAYHGMQPGDPKKLAQVVAELGHSEQPPLHLPIGTDSVNMYRSQAAQLGKDVEAWLSVANSTDHEKK